MNAPARTFITPEDYLKNERLEAQRHEYYHGEVSAMPGGTESHSLIGSNLGRVLGNLLLNTPCVVYNSDMRVKVEVTGLYTYPDVSVVCGGTHFDDDRRDTLLNPLVIVEVLSPSTERYDRGTKFHQYQKISSLQEYILISQEDFRVECFTRLPTGEWLLSSSSGLDATFHLSSLDLDIPLRDLYHKVELSPPSPPPGRRCQIRGSLLGSLLTSPDIP